MYNNGLLFSLKLIRKRIRQKYFIIMACGLSLSTSISSTDTAYETSEFTESGHSLKLKTTKSSASPLSSYHKIDVLSSSISVTDPYTIERINDDRLIQKIIKIPPTQIRDVFEKYKRTIRSACDVEHYPLYFVIYCLIEMERNGDPINGGSLFTKCDDLLNRLPPKFLDKLTLKLVGLSDFGDLSNSNITPSNETISEPEGEDAVDGVSNITNESSVLQFDLNGKSSSMLASLAYNIQTLVGSSNNTRRGQDEQRREGSQTDSVSKEMRANLRIQDALFAITNENKLLEDCKQCVKCHVKPRGITFLPCGHFTMCRECAGPTYICSSCHKSVLATIDTFLS